MTHKIQVICARLLVSLAALFPAAALAAPQLLVPYEGAVAKNSAAPKDFKSDGARVKFNLGALRALKHGDDVDLTLPNGTTHKIVFELLKDHGNGTFSWVGHYKGSTEKLRVILTTGPGGTFGSIATPSGVYRLVPGEGFDWLVDMAAEETHAPPTDLRDDIRVPPPMPKSVVPQKYAPEFVDAVPGVNTVAVSKATPSLVVVDIMVVYTNGLLANLGATNLNTRINNLITAANTSYADSEVGITLRLVGTQLVTYSDAIDGGTALDAISPAGGVDPVFANIETLRTSLGADMVALLRNGASSGGSGIAWIANGPISSGFAPYLYSVTTGCTSLCDWVFIHELGHNMGNAHDRATSAWQNGGVAEPGSYSYSYGYYSCSGGPLALSCDAFADACGPQPECNTPRAGTNNFADIMAYFHGTTTRNIKFSNPSLNCSGAIGVQQACGVNDGMSDSANAALSMNNNRVALSAIRPTMVAPPTSPTTTAISSSPNPSAAGQSVAIFASVSGAGATPTGTLHFRANGTSVTGCTAVALSAAGAAGCNTTTLATATHSLTAQYSGNSAYSGSTSTGLTHTVTSNVTPTVAVTTSLTPANTGMTVNLYATVSGPSGTPTGSVEYRDGASVIPGCGSVVMSGGLALCALGNLAAGGHSITARYLGGPGYNIATSPAITQNILAVPAGSQNAALAAAGSLASASSTYSASFPASAVINGDRAGLGWGGGSGWNDATVNAYPDWVQVNFTASRAIDRVIVYTMQDNSSAPSEPTDSMTFTSYGVVNFTVQGWNGSAWVTLGTVTGNNLVKRTVNFASYTTDRIRVNVTSALGGYSHITEVEAWTTDTTPAPGSNVALASAGGVASVSSAGAGNFPATSLNNGDRAGLNWGAGGGWKDATPGVYPDWAEILFNGSKTIDRVVVYSLQDSPGTPVEPGDSTTFVNFGVVAFTVQGWNGSAWVTLGTVSGNNLVKRTVSFAAFTTDRIRVNITNALSGVSRLVEIEALTPSGVASNFALSSVGATASASSTGAGNFPASSVINGDRAGMNWGAGGGWKDATPSAYPDWLRIDFNATRTIDRVVVYSLQDSPGSPVEPSDSLTFVNFGVANFTVEQWNGSAWVTVGTVTGNNLVKRTVTFTPVATSAIRIVITNALSGVSRLVEVEAFGS